MIVLLGGQGRNRTTDTRIFSPLLYRLSYLAIIRIVAEARIKAIPGLAVKPPIATTALTHELAGWTFFLRPATRQPPWLAFRALITAPTAFRGGLKVIDFIPARAGAQTNPAVPGRGRARVSDRAAEVRRAAIRGAVAAAGAAAAPATPGAASDWRKSHAPSAETPARPVLGRGA